MSCGGGDSGGGGSSGGNGGDGGGDNGGDGGGDNGGDGGGSGRTPATTQVEWSIIPFAEGLRIEWHNLATFKPTPTSIYLNLTSRINPPQSRREVITIEDFTNSSYEITGLTNGRTYHVVVEVIVEFTNNVSRVIPIDWLEQTDQLSNNSIMVGSNHDGDGLADRVDEDDDNDGVPDDHPDLCPQGELDWLPNSTNDSDNDGCRDEGEDMDDDNDGVADGDEIEGCELDPDCDGDSYNDGVDAFPTNSSEGLDTDYDRVGDNSDNCPLLANSDQLDTDGDDAGDVCDNDKDGDGVANGGEVAGCELLVDCDGDTKDDIVDIDDDGDGLIELRTAEELSAVRYQLDGTGFKADELAGLNRSGCGGEGGIADCGGYELVHNISLRDYIAEHDATAGWQPIAADCSGNGFSAIFDGNDFGIIDLWINRSQQDCIGLFGRVTGTIRHLGVVADGITGKANVGSLVGNGDSAEFIHSYAVVTGSVNGGGDYVGGLVGDGDSAEFIHSYAVVTDEVRGGNNYVGGLVGDGRSAEFMHSYAVTGEVRGRRNYVGGLVGYAWVGLINRSYGVSGDISGNNYVGGLAGSGLAAEIIGSYGVSDAVNGNQYVGGLTGRVTGSAPVIQSYAVTGEVRGRGDYVGGLVGYGQSDRFVQSYAISGEVYGRRNNVGGLVGYGDSANIRSSYAVTGEVNGEDHVGGLVGNGNRASIDFSYGVNGKVEGNNNIGGLVGYGIEASIVRSYAVNGIVNGSNYVGGLVGINSIGRNIQSYAVSSLVSGNNFVGGLSGDSGSDGTKVSGIIQSYAVTGEVRGNSNVGGLAGRTTKFNKIVHSYAVSGEVSGNSAVGGLTVGSISGDSSANYWDAETSGRTGSGGKTSMELRSPTDYVELYSSWDDGPISDGTRLAGVDHNGSIWCDEDLSGVIEDDEKRDNSHANGDNRIWDFGTDTDYPIIRCTPDSLADQRAWWSLTGGEPRLDQNRLDALLDSLLP